MYDEDQGLANPIEELLLIYREIMGNLCFDQYALYEQKASELFEQIISMQQLTESDRLLLTEVQIIHAQIIQVIIEEKADLKREIEIFESKKRVSNQYGRLSNNYDVGAFFMDYKK